MHSVSASGDFRLSQFRLCVHVGFVFRIARVGKKESDDDSDKEEDDDDWTFVPEKRCKNSLLFICSRVPIPIVPNTVVCFPVPYKFFVLPFS